jgi:hypothetical protein
VNFLQLSGDFLHPLAINSEALTGGQGLTGELEQDAFKNWSRWGHMSGRVCTTGFKVSS